MRAPFDVASHLKDEDRIGAFRRAIDSFGDRALSAAADRQILRARTMRTPSPLPQGEVARSAGEGLSLDDLLFDDFAARRATLAGEAA